MTRVAAVKASVVGVLAVASTLLFAGSVASAGGFRTYRCDGGAIPSGTYADIVVAGPCSVGAGAVIHVRGTVLVRSGAVLDAQSAPSTFTVGRDVVGFPGSMIGLGCQPPEYTGNSAHPCEIDPTGHSTISVNGNVTIFGAVGVFLNGIVVGHDVTVLGGGSEIPWSVKNNTIRGNLAMAGQTEEWIGILFNTIHKNVLLAHIKMTGANDETGSGTNPLFVVRNSIGRNIACLGLDPGVFGYGNTIAHQALGQCASLAASPPAAS